MVAGVASGVGKTSVSVGLMAALRASGYAIRAAKVGPDYIDPSYHRIATGRPSYNLDLFMTGAAGVKESFRRASIGAQLCVVEGVMGLFDGSDRPGLDDTGSAPRESKLARRLGWHSSFEVAQELGLPVVLVMDARSTSHSLAAVAYGFASLAGEGVIRGVILNRIRSERHASLATEALRSVGINLLGVIKEGALPTFESRHLGLVPSEARLAEANQDIAHLGQAMKEAVDLEALLREFAAVKVPAAPQNEVPRAAPIVIAVAQGPAFSFTYQENLDILSEAGGEIVGFDPASEKLPPRAAAVILGGGFPELYTSEIGANLPKLAALKEMHRQGLPIWAECGGLMLLGRSIDGKAGLGILDVATHMTKRLSLGYQRATSQRESLLFPARTKIFGHEFHYSLADPTGDLLSNDYEAGRGHGFGSPKLYASYLHLHLGSSQDIAQRFLGAARRYLSAKAKDG